MYYNLIVKDILGLDSLKKEVVSGVAIVTSENVFKNDLANILAGAFISTNEWNGFREKNSSDPVSVFCGLEPESKRNFIESLFLKIKGKKLAKDVFLEDFFFRFDRDDIVVDDYLTDLTDIDAVLTTERYLKVLAQGIVRLWKNRKLVDGENPRFKLYFAKKVYAEKEDIGITEIDVYAKKLMEASGNLLDKEDIKAFQDVLRVTYTKGEKSITPLFNKDDYNIALQIHIQVTEINNEIKLREPNIDNLKTKLNKLQDFIESVYDVNNEVYSKEKLEEFNGDIKKIKCALVSNKIADAKCLITEVNSYTAILKFDNIDSTIPVNGRDRLNKYLEHLENIAANFVINDDSFRVVKISTNKDFVSHQELLYQDLKNENLGEFYVKAILKPQIFENGVFSSGLEFKSKYEMWINEIVLELEYAAKAFVSMSLAEKARVCAAIDSYLQYSVRDKMLDIPNQIAIEKMKEIFENFENEFKEANSSLRVVKEMLLNLDLYLLKVLINQNVCLEVEQLSKRLENQLEELRENNRIEHQKYQNYYGILKTSILLYLLDQFDFKECAKEAKEVLKNKFLTDIQLGKIANIYILAKTGSLRGYVYSDGNQVSSRSCFIDIVNMGRYAIEKFAFSNEGDVKRTYYNLAVACAVMDLQGLSLAFLKKAIYTGTDLNCKNVDDYICKFIENVYFAVQLYNRDKTDEPVLTEFFKGTNNLNVLKALIEHRDESFEAVSNYISNNTKVKWKVNRSKGLSNYYDYFVFMEICEKVDDEIIDDEIIGDASFISIDKDIIEKGGFYESAKNVDTIFNKIAFFKAITTKKIKRYKLDSNIAKLDDCGNVYPECVYYWQLAETTFLYNGINNENIAMVTTLYDNALKCFEREFNTTENDNLKNTPALLVIKIGVLASYIRCLLGIAKEIGDKEYVERGKKLYDQLYKCWELFNSITCEKSKKKGEKHLPLNIFSGGSFRTQMTEKFPKEDYVNFMARLEKISKLVPY